MRCGVAVERDMMSSFPGWVEPTLGFVSVFNGARSTLSLLLAKVSYQVTRTKWLHTFRRLLLAVSSAPTGDPFIYVPRLNDWFSVPEHPGK